MNTTKITLRIDAADLEIYKQAFPIGGWQGEMKAAITARARQLQKRLAKRRAAPQDIISEVLDANDAR